MRPRVLVADDESPIRTALRKIIEELGCDVTPVSDGRQALDALGRGAYQLVVTDLRMPEADGLQVVRAAAERRLPVIVLTGHGTVDSAVEAMRLGATDFLTKPFELHQVERVVRAALSIGPQASSRPSSGGRPGSGGQRSERGPEQTLIGTSAAMDQVRALVDRFADSDGTVLLTGESGTGKEVVAHLIHERSRRRGGPFIAVNCAAIPEQLLESELFGHTRGSFTGATQQRTGRFTQAAGGTLFLDEIAEMSSALQAKVLRVLQDKEVTPVGANRSQRVDVRILAATNRDLMDMVAADRFRADLYYRLYVLLIPLPPLRSRVEDIPALCTHFLTRAFIRRGQADLALSEVLSAGAMERLQSYPFPGNVRELENLIERVVHLRHEGQVLGPADLPLLGPRPGRGRPVSGGYGGQVAALSAARAPAELPEWLQAAYPHLPDGGFDMRDQMESIERSLIAQALHRSGGSRKMAAELLRIKRTTLVMRMRRHGLEDPGRPPSGEPAPADDQPNRDHQEAAEDDDPDQGSTS